VEVWREAYFYGLLVAAVFIPFDLLYPRMLWLTVSTRTVLVATLLACWWRLGRAQRAGSGRTVVAGALATAVLAPLPVLFAGGCEGPRFGFLLSVPFILLALLPEVPVIAAFAGLMAGAIGGALLVAEGRQAAFVAEWTIVATVVTGVTIFGARRVQAMANRIYEAERERHQALAELAETRRRQAASAQLALLGRLAAGIGHEINNPLSAVKGNVLYALEELERAGLAPNAREALAEALSASERISWISADMRALSADASAPLVPCRVCQAVNEALTLAGTRIAGAKVLTTLEPGLPAVRSQPRLLAAALSHLAARAAASREGGPEEPPTIRIGARRREREIEIAVEDDGPPIPAVVLERIFEPFAAQGEVRGAGLGLMLPMTRVLAERGGGRVSASSHDGGNRFTVTLSVADD
jgi:C4-dicarboxylate-specific signal transduction histidine kinase